MFFSDGGGSIHCCFSSAASPRAKHHGKGSGSGSHQTGTFCHQLLQDFQWFLFCFVLFVFCFEIRSFYVAQAGLKLMIFLPQPGLQA
jgi:hypothetical protein